MATNGTGQVLSQEELVELAAYCYEMFANHETVDYYSTTVGITLLIILGVLGNAGTLWTLSGRRLTTATYMYYRAIAWADLVRCALLVSYVLRVVIPFGDYYYATWYEARIMYFLIGVSAFLGMSLAVILCVRLVTGILQSRRLIKTKTNPRAARMSIWITFGVAIWVNFLICFEYDVAVRPDMCKLNASNASEQPAYVIIPSDFHMRHPGLLQAVHLLPIVILLVLMCGAASILACCLVTVPTFSRRTSASSKSSSANTLLAHCPSLRHSRPWRTQRQLCQLFLLLSICYAIGLMPTFLSTVLFSKVEQDGGAFTADNFRRSLRKTFDRENFSAISNIFVNFGHAVSFYVYVLCSDAFRGEFLSKVNHWKSRFLSRACPKGGPFAGMLFGEKIVSQSTDTKGQVRTTLLAEIESDEAATFPGENPRFTTGLPMTEVAPSLVDAPVPLTAPISFSYAPLLTADKRTMAKLSEMQKIDTTLNVECENHHATSAVCAVLNDENTEILSPVQLQPHRYQRFYSTTSSKKSSNA